MKDRKVQRGKESWKVKLKTKEWEVLDVVRMTCRRNDRKRTMRRLRTNLKVGERWDWWLRRSERGRERERERKWSGEERNPNNVQKNESWTWFMVSSGDTFQHSDRPLNVWSCCKNAENRVIFASNDTSHLLLNGSPSSINIQSIALGLRLEGKPLRERKSAD